MMFDKITNSDNHINRTVYEIFLKLPNVLFKKYTLPSRGGIGQIYMGARFVFF